MSDQQHPLCRCGPTELLALNRRNRRWLVRNKRTAEFVTEHQRGCPIAVSQRSTIRPGRQTRRAS